MACLRADLERVGGWDEQLPDDLADVDLALRLVDSGVDPVWARHAVSYYDVAVHPLAEMVQRRQPNRSVSALLAAHPRARARLLVGGIFWHRRHAEAMLAVAAVLLSRCDRRAALLAVPWLHERLHLTPAAGGLRRRWFVLPGVFAFDLYDALLTTAARLRPPRES
jgi:GT2 family glycosyltransferase